MPQLSQSGRIVKGVAVSQGYVFYFLPGDTAPTATINLTGEDPPLNATGLVQSSVNIQKMVFCDGVNLVYYDPSNDTVYPLLATAGQVPQDSDGNVPRLTCLWRGRTMFSGLFGDPQNIFGSAVGDFTNYNYAPQNPSATQAFALNFANMGLIGDSVTSLCSFSDDILIVFGDHSINLLRGDPMDGGRRDLVTDTIGGAWGKPWCMGPDGTIYFFSNKMGIYQFIPGAKPVRISGPIDNLLSPINTGTNGITMEWDAVGQGFVVFITPLTAPAATTHWWYDWRCQAWWPIKFKNPLHNPLCTCTIDGNEPDDRVVLLGSFDGFIRALSPTATTDDGEAIEAEVVVGPILTAEFDAVMWDTHQCILGTDSGTVNYELYSEATAELALAALVSRTRPRATGSWSGTNGPDGVYGGRNPTERPHVSAHAHYLRLFTSEQFAFESLRVKAGPRGDIRRRGLGVG